MLVSYKLAYMCAHIHVLRLRRHVYKNGAQDLLDAWNSKEMRVLVAKGKHTCCMHDVLLFLKGAHFPEE